MAWRGRLFGVCAAFGAAVVFSGCLAQTATPGPLPVSRDTPFVLNEPETFPHTTTARLQQSEIPDPPAPPSGSPPAPPAPMATQQVMPAPPGQAVTPTPGIQPVSMTVTAKSQGPVRVRAWVNGKPIFEDEVFNILGPQLGRIYRETPPADRDAEQQKAFNKTLEALIDNELLMQDALRLLEKQAPKALESLKSKTSKETQKQIATMMRQMNITTMEEYKQKLQAQGTTIESVRRMMERDTIAREYLFAKVKPPVEKEVSHDVIYEYYKEHLNEYMQVDRVKWQDIFIAVGPKHPTMADARRFAEQILQRWMTGEDIAKLLEFDDGDSRYRKGEGAGEIKGDIKPRELQPSLFALKDGEFGPPVELTTGVHIYRLLKREFAGVMPFDEKTQSMIGSKLRNEMAEQERQHLIRQLRERAVIEIER
jgi:peptidyl-prolyl cis-trans isomerase SurA